MVRIFNHHLKLPVVLMGLGEAAVFLLSAYLAVWFGLAHDSAQSLASPRALGFCIVMLLSMLAMGLYQQRLQPGVFSVLLRVVMSYVFGGMVLLGLMLMFPALRFDLQFMLAAIGLSLLGVALTRSVFSSMSLNHAFKRRVLVLGTGQKAGLIERRLHGKTGWCSYEIVGFMGQAVTASGIHPDKQVCLGAGQSLSDYVQAHHIHEIVEALDDRRQGFPVSELLKCKNLRVSVINLQTLFEREAGLISLSLLEPGQIIYSDGFLQTGVRRIVKRLVDLGSALLLLAVSWPLMLLTALLIWLESGGWGSVLYTQQRVGRNGRLFTIYKFRSMRRDAERQGAVWARQQDDRVTRVGRVIRKYRIDELPQIFNVLRGDMGLVGPRPERPEFDGKLQQELPYYLQRYQIKPGITGWAQLCYPYGASLEDAREKLQYDLYYVKNQSFLFDVMILLQTVEVVLFGKGAR